MTAVQVICDTCRAPGMIPASHWWAHCPNVLCPSRDKLLLGPAPPGKKYIRIDCLAVAYRCVDQTCQTQLCDCCHTEHTIDDVIGQVRNSQPIYKTHKAATLPVKREERQEIAKKEPLVEIDIGDEAVVEENNNEVVKKVTKKTSLPSSGVWVTCDKCRAVREMPANNYWLHCPCGDTLFAPLRNGLKYIRIKCKVISYRAVHEREVVAMCDCCGPSPVEHSIGNTLVEVRNGQRVYGTAKSSSNFQKQFDKLRAVGKELFSTNKECNKEKVAEEHSGASAPPMETLDMGAKSEKKEKGEAEKEKTLPDAVYPEIPETDRLMQEKAHLEEVLRQKDAELGELRSRLSTNEAECADQLALTEDALNTAVAALKLATKELNTERETVARMREENREAETLLAEILGDHQRRILAWEGQVEGLKKALAVEKKENEVLSASILNLTVLLRNSTSSNPTASQEAPPVMVPVAVPCVEESVSSPDPVSLDEFVEKFPVAENSLLKDTSQKKEEEALKRLASLGFWKEENNNSCKNNNRDKWNIVEKGDTCLEEAVTEEEKEADASIVGY